MLNGIPDAEHAEAKCEACSRGGQLEIANVASHGLELLLQLRGLLIGILIKHSCWNWRYIKDRVPIVQFKGECFGWKLPEPAQFLDSVEKLSLDGSFSPYKIRCEGKPERHSCEPPTKSLIATPQSQSSFSINVSSAKYVRLRSMPSQALFSHGAASRTNRSRLWMPMDHAN